MERKINIDFFPITGGSNPYIDILKNGVLETGRANIRSFSFNPIKYLKHDVDTDVVYLNWYDNIQNKNAFRTLLSANKRLFLLKAIKYRKIKIFIVVHNRLPHNAVDIGIIKWFMRKIFSMADRLVILSMGTKDAIKDVLGDRYYQTIKDKFILIPCTDYFSAYPNRHKDFRVVWNVDKNDFVYLFFGSIQPYKNIELVIETAKEITTRHNNAKFVFMGGCSEEYLKKLQELVAGNTSIVFLPERIADEDMFSVIESSDIVIIPLDQKSSLNSGTCFLTFSCGKNVICPRIAALRDFENDVFFDYDYNDVGNHRSELLKMSEMAISEHETDLDKFHERENIIVDELKINYSGVKIGQRLQKAFEECVLNDIQLY